MNILISVDPLTDLISDLVSKELGEMAWGGIPVSIMTEAIGFFNAEGMDAASSSIFESFHRKGLWTGDNVRAIDNIVESFGQTFNVCSDQKGQRAEVEYDSVSNTAIVRTVPVVERADAYLNNLKDDYHHALERSDFIPERLRRAFEELSR